MLNRCVRASLRPELWAAAVSGLAVDAASGASPGEADGAAQGRAPGPLAILGEEAGARAQGRQGYTWTWPSGYKWTGGK